MSIKLSHPIPGARMTDRFGWRPAIPGVIGAGLHNGQDYAAGSGTMIRAAAAGVVTYRGWDATGGGWMLRIDHGGGYQTLYLHMRENSPLVWQGQRVGVGVGIGHVGSTGNSNGPHLHFMLERNGTPIDPVPYITSAPAKPQTPTPSTGQEEDEDMIFIRRNNQAKVYAWSPLRGTKRAIGTTEWNAIKRAYGAAGLKLPIINTSAAETKHFGI